MIPLSPMMSEKLPDLAAMKFATNNIADPMRMQAQQFKAIMQNLNDLSDQSGEVDGKISAKLDAPEQDQSATGESAEGLSPQNVLTLDTDTENDSEYERIATSESSDLVTDLVDEDADVGLSFWPDRAADAKTGAENFKAEIHIASKTGPVWAAETNAKQNGVSSAAEKSRFSKEPSQRVSQSMEGVVAGFDVDNSKTSAPQKLPNGAVAEGVDLRQARGALTVPQQTGQQVVTAISPKAIDLSSLTNFSHAFNLTNQSKALSKSDDVVTQVHPTEKPSFVTAQVQTVSDRNVRPASETSVQSSLPATPKTSVMGRHYSIAEITFSPTVDGPLPIEVGDRPISATSSHSTHQIGAPAAPQMELARNVATQIAVTVTQSGGGITELQLSPEELGRVRITLTGAEGGMTVAILADRPETLDLMRRHIDQMAQEFRALGYDNLRFSFGSQSGAASDNGQSDQANLGTKSSGPQSEQVVESAAAPTQSRAGLTGLDVRF